MRINTLAPQRRHTATTLAARGHYRRHQHRRAATVVLLAATVGVGLAVSACTTRISGTPTAATTSIPSTSESDPTTRGEGQHGDTTSAAESGGTSTDRPPGGQPDPDQGAGEPPFDPCSVFSWKDFPADQQPVPPDTAPPTPQQAGENVPFLAACLWNASGVKTFVVWGTPPKMAVEPTGDKDEQLTDINGHRTLYRPDDIVDGSRSCPLFVDLGDGRGTAGLLINTTRPEVDPCATALSLATIIVDRVS